MKKDKINSIQKLVLKKLVIYFTLMILGVWTVMSITSALTRNFFNNLNFGLDITSLDASQLSEAYLVQNEAQVLVLDENYSVKFETGADISSQKAFSGMEVTEIVANTNPTQEYHASFMPVATYSYSVDEGDGSVMQNIPPIEGATLPAIPSSSDFTVAVQPATDYMLLLQKDVMSASDVNFSPLSFFMMANIVCIILLVIVTLLLFVRSVYLPIKANFELIEENLSNAPYGTAPADVSRATLKESRSVLSAYNLMVAAISSESAQKQKAVEQNRQLVANLAHDLKSPITVLKGYSEVLADGTCDEQSQKEYISYIGKSANDLDGLVSLIFEQTKYQAESNLSFVLADINAILRDVCANYYMIFDKRGFEFLSDIGEDSHVMPLDAVHIKRVFTNLLQNILNHNDNPTRVLVSSCLEDGHFVIKIKDDGCGISEENREKVFDAFYQIDSSRNRQNSGIGLYVARQIVEKHGGKITISEEDEYKTVFTITLK